jgi:hypothetical protein
VHAVGEQLDDEVGVYDAREGGKVDVGERANLCVAKLKMTTSIL